MVHLGKELHVQDGAGIRDGVHLRRGVGGGQRWERVRDGTGVRDGVNIKDYTGNRDWDVTVCFAQCLLILKLF